MIDEIVITGELLLYLKTVSEPSAVRCRGVFPINS